MIVWPNAELYVRLDESGFSRWGNFADQSGDPWGNPPSGPPRRLSLMRSGGSWLISDDFSLDPSIPESMAAGGAPKGVWKAEERRINAAVDHVFPVPDGIRATFEKFLILLNEHRYKETDALFVGGHGYRAYMFASPFANWHNALKWMSGFSPLSEVAVESYPNVPFVVEASGPYSDTGGYDHAGGGMFGPSTWMAHRTADGRWVIEGYATDVPFGSPSPFH